MGWIYIFVNTLNGKVYIGKWSKKRVETRRDQHRFGKGKGYSKHLYNAIQKDGWDNFIFDTLHHAPKEMLADLEIQEIARFGCNSNQGGWGYNKTNGGDGFTSEDARVISRENARKRVADGTHHFLGGEIARKRVADGTHNFQGDNNPSHKRVADGTHHFLGGEIARKRVADGTHNFLDSEIQRENARKRVANRTHHFLGGEIQHKRIAEGTHNLLRENNPKARPEYMQVYWEFIILLPLGIKEARKHLYEKFSDIPRQTIWRWAEKWKTELVSK